MTISLRQRTPASMSRRQALGSLLQTAGVAALCPSAGAQTSSALDRSLPSFENTAAALAPEDDAFLDELERAAFFYFWEQSNPGTGLVKDRSNMRVADNGVVASIAATGFGLTALAIGAERGYVPASEARDRALAALRFLHGRMPVHRGFYFHWANVHTGERIWDSEISSIDTAILLCGVLTCRQYFRHREIIRLASEIFNRVDWTWLSADTALLPHGWTPEFGFLQYRWDYYSELMMMYLLGVGATRYKLPVETWHAWKRVTFEYHGLRYIGSHAPLFVHQYSQAWFDFRGKRDRYADYFRNSVLATEVHRRFCLELAPRYPHYSDDLWGITASDSKNGYVAWGGPPEMGPLDGTVVPSAAGGSLPFLPQATLRVLKHIKRRYGDRTWTRYGFVNAFNPMTNWYDTDVVGIDTGITMLMAENLRSGFVWNTFKRNREVQRALAGAGFAAAPGPAEEKARRMVSG
jgi:hypothetical protein